MRRSYMSMDDGMNSELVKHSVFDGYYELPIIKRPNYMIIPSGFTPFTQKDRVIAETEALSFFEFDRYFNDFVKYPAKYLDVCRKFAVVISPDCSVYRDMPLVLQIANIYKSRAIGSFLQHHNINVYPLVRWGDERTYQDTVESRPIAFLGIERRSIVVISTYGCIKGRDNTHHFTKGLEQLLYHLEPSHVLVHGAFPDRIFEPYLKCTKFHRYPDWISRMKRAH